MSNTKHTYPKGYIPPRMQTSTPAPSLATGLGAKEGQMGTPTSRTWAPLGPAPAKRFPYQNYNLTPEERKKEDARVAEEHLKQDEDEEKRANDLLIEQDEYAQRATAPKPLPKVPSIREVIEAGPTVRERDAIHRRAGGAGVGPEDDEDEDVRQTQRGSGAQALDTRDRPTMSLSTRMRQAGRM
jgi:hypothetical protein